VAKVKGSNGRRRANFFLLHFLWRQIRGQGQVREGELVEKTIGKSRRRLF